MDREKQEPYETGPLVQKRCGVSSELSLRPFILPSHEKEGRKGQVPMGRGGRRGDWHGSCCCRTELSWCCVDQGGGSGHSQKSGLRRSSQPAWGWGGVRAGGYVPGLALSFYISFSL